MKKSTKIALSLVVGTLLLNGCSSSSDGDTDTPPAVPTDVTVERGAVYDANVTDANGTVATSLNNTNVYRFKDTPVYPISVNGGWIDVNGDKNMTTEDVKLDFEMKSYSNIVTPITTYIADENATMREKKLEELAEILYIPDNNTSNFKKLPSQSTSNIVEIHNAIYKLIKENNNSISLINKNTIGYAYGGISNDEETYDKSLPYHVAVEKQIISNLNADGKISYLEQPFIDNYKKEEPTNDEEQSKLDTFVDTVKDGASDVIEQGKESVSDLTDDKEEAKVEPTNPIMPNEDYNIVSPYSPSSNEDYNLTKDIEDSNIISPYSPSSNEDYNLTKDIENSNIISPFPQVPVIVSPYES